LPPLRTRTVAVAGWPLANVLARDSVTVAGVASWNSVGSLNERPHEPWIDTPGTGS
jgi:hypothetical protein